MVPLKTFFGNATSFRMLYVSTGPDTKAERPASPVQVRSTAIPDSSSSARALGPLPAGGLRGARYATSVERRLPSRVLPD